MNINPQPLVYSGPAKYEGVTLAEFSPRSAADKLLLLTAMTKRRADILQELCDMDHSRDKHFEVGNALRSECSAIAIRYYNLTGFFL